MYEIKLIIYSEYQNLENPTFICEDFKELVDMISFFFGNGYELMVREIRK